MDRIVTDEWEYSKVLINRFEEEMGKTLLGKISRRMARKYFEKLLKDGKIERREEWESDRWKKGCPNHKLVLYRKVQPIPEGMADG